MIVGFTKDDESCFGHKVGDTHHGGTPIGRWGVEMGGKAIASSPLTRHSILGHYRFFETKRLQQKMNEAEWDEPVQGFTKKGNSSMKWSLVVLIVMLLAMPAAGVAQQTQAPAATDASQTSPTPTKDTSDIAHYIIGPEDTLQVTVWKEPTLSASVPVRPDGRISLVLLGDLQAAGMTPMQLAADITQRLKKYIQDPSVSVVVLAVNSQRIFIIGEVGHVGAVAMTAGMTPLQAIAAAGGLSAFANSKHIYILRGTGTKQQKIPFNYKQALKGDSKQDVSLLPGDTIVVP
jgi:polysaccharide export outer membrane protein